MKYLELDNGGAVSIDNVIAVTCEQYEGIGKSHVLDEWRVRVHLTSGTWLDVATVKASNDLAVRGNGGIGGNVEANGRAYLAALDWARKIRSMMLDREPDRRMSIWGELVDLDGQTITEDDEPRPGTWDEDDGYPYPDVTEYVILAAVVVPVRGGGGEKAHEAVHAVLSEGVTAGLIGEWWIAEDTRKDGSDRDSAVFVPKGRQAYYRHLIDGQAKK